MKSIVVLSGGMDSVVALNFAKRILQHDVIKTVSFNYGSKHNDREWQCAKAQSDLLGIENLRVDLTSMGQHLKSDLLKSGGDIPEGHYADPSMKRTVVPFRNGIMLSIAAGIAESHDAEAIILGNHFGDHAIYPDCRASFVDPMAQAIKAGTYKEVNLLAPFTMMSKTNIASIGALLGVDFTQTYSCYKGHEDHCGKCGTRFERKEAFKESGIKDPTRYNEAL